MMAIVIQILLSKFLGPEKIYLMKQNPIYYFFETFDHWRLGLELSFGKQIL